MVKGSTNLASAFDRIENDGASNKKVIIITDGDCDPGLSSNLSTRSPFHTATDINGKYKHLPTNSYLIVNVSVDNMSFPFLAIDPKVCYLTGNNPKTMSGFIKAVIMSIQMNTQITPQLIMQYSLDQDELKLPVSVPSFSNLLTDEEIKDVFTAFMNNSAPKESESSNNDDESTDQSVSTLWN